MGGAVLVCVCYLDVEHATSCYSSSSGAAPQLGAFNQPTPLWLMASSDAPHSHNTHTHTHAHMRAHTPVDTATSQSTHSTLTPTKV
jgi:hypothetical protein